MSIPFADGSAAAGAAAAGAAGAGQQGGQKPNSNYYATEVFKVLGITEGDLSGGARNNYAGERGGASNNFYVQVGRKDITGLTEASDTDTPEESADEENI